MDVCSLIFEQKSKYSLKSLPQIVHVLLGFIFSMKRTMRHTHVLIYLAVMLGLVVACDSHQDETEDVLVPPTEGSETEVWPTPPDPTLANFLPMEIGTTWRYAYTYGASSILSYTERRVDSGFVELTVVDKACSHGRCRVSLDQVISLERSEWTEGLPRNDTTVTPITIASEVIAVEHEDGVVHHPYIIGALQRFHTAEVDTVSLQPQATFRLHPSLNATANWLNLTLSQEEGIIEARFASLGSVAVNNGGLLKLVDIRRP